MERDETLGGSDDGSTARGDLCHDVEEVWIECGKMCHVVPSWRNS